MNAREQTDFVFGNRGDYRWMACSDPSAHLGDLVDACPTVVAGKYVTVTSCDSSPLRLTDSDRKAGWVADGGVAVSPKVTHADTDLCFCEWDEWWIFDTPTPVGDHEVFVN